MRSIKTKLILAVSILIVGLLGLTSVLLINEKIAELESDIYLKARTFAELVSPKILENHDLYLKEGSFLYFNREITNIFKQNEDISGIKIISFAGEVLYDSGTESERQYSGGKRTVKADQLEQIKAPYPSLILAEGGVVYLKKDLAGNYGFVDKEGNYLEKEPEIKRITNIIFTLENEYAIIYDVSYRHLDERISRTMQRIILLSVFGIIIGILVAYFLASGLTKPLFSLKETVLKIAKGDFAQRVVVKVKDEVGVLAGAVNQMAHDLEISTKALVYKERVAKELELAAKIQTQILPKQMPKFASIEFAAEVIPATEIGGDVYDVLVTGTEKCVAYLGDVTGHGVPSGMLSAVANAVIYSHAGKESCKDILIKANQVLVAKSQPNMFITMVMMDWDGVSQAKYVNAGHEKVLCYKAKDKKVIEEKRGGVALGMFPDIAGKLEERIIQLETGDCILFYSDGIPECWKNEKESFGFDRLKEALGKAGELKNAEEIKKFIIDSAKNFAAGYEQKDDITVMVIKKL